MAGTYQWHAVYTSGDGNNLTASDDGKNESTVVSPAHSLRSRISSKFVITMYVRFSILPWPSAVVVTVAT